MSQKGIGSKNLQNGLRELFLQIKDLIQLVFNQLQLNSVLNKVIIYLNNYSLQPLLKVVKIWSKADVSKNLCVGKHQFFKRRKER